MSVLSTLCMSLLMNCHFVIVILTNSTNCAVSNPAFMLIYVING